MNFPFISVLLSEFVEGALTFWYKVVYTLRRFSFNDFQICLLISKSYKYRLL